MINNRNDSQRHRRSDKFRDWYESYHREATQNRHYAQDIDKVLYLWLENWRGSYPELFTLIDNRKTLAYCLFEVKTGTEQLTNDQRQCTIDRAAELDCPAFVITSGLESDCPYIIAKPLNELGMTYRTEPFQSALVFTSEWSKFLDRLLHDRIRRFIANRR